MNAYFFLFWTENQENAWLVVDSHRNIRHLHLTRTGNCWNKNLLYTSRDASIKHPARCFVQSIPPATSMHLFNSHPCSMIWRIPTIFFSTKCTIHIIQVTALSQRNPLTSSCPFHKQQFFCRVELPSQQHHALDQYLGTIVEEVLSGRTWNCSNAKPCSNPYWDFFWNNGGKSPKIDIPSS